MNEKELVPELSTCQRLEELGWKSKTYFKWTETLQGWNPFPFGAYGDGNTHKDSYHAPSAEELGEVIPHKIMKSYQFHIGKYYDKWECWYTNAIDTKANQSSISMSESMAKMVIWLCENDQIKL